MLYDDYEHGDKHWLRHARAALRNAEVAGIYENVKRVAAEEDIRRLASRDTGL